MQIHWVLPCVPLAGWPALLRLHPHLHIFSSQPAAVRSVTVVASNLWPKRDGAWWGTSSGEKKVLPTPRIVILDVVPCLSPGGAERPLDLRETSELLNIQTCWYQPVREASGRFSRAMSKASWNLSQSTAAQKSQRHPEHGTTCRLVCHVSLGFPAVPGSLATWGQKSGSILAPWSAWANFWHSAWNTGRQISFKVYEVCTYDSSSSSTLW